MEQCYRDFMGGCDSFDQMDAELEKKIRENIGGDSIEDIADKHHRLSEELLRLEQQPVRTQQTK